MIDIGSNLVKMRVAQLQNGVIQDLDHLEYPIHLGHEVFQDGKISFDSLKELSSILRGFSQVMMEYGVSQSKIVATTVFREAHNRAYIVDQLKIQNDMNIEILEEDQEKTLIYSEILRELSGGELPHVSQALISYVGTGSIGLALFREGNMVFSQNIPLGSLKLRDLLSGIREKSVDYSTALDEYLDGVIRRIPLLHSEEKPEYLLITGTELELIAKISATPLKKGCYTIDAKKLRDLSHTFGSMTPEHIGERYGITPGQAELVYTALALIQHILTLTNAKKIISPKIELWDAIVRQLLFSKSKSEYDEHVRQSALSCARTISSHYYSNPKHLETVRELSLIHI